MKQSDIEKDYWRYYVQIPYKSPVSKTYVDENGKEHTEYKCCFPVKLTEWDEYSEYAYPILTISPTLLERRLGLDLDKVSLFDYVVVMCLENEMIKELERMFSMAFREEIFGIVVGKGESQEIRFVFASDNDFYIDRHNYEDVRQILMAQSFYFDPIVGKNERSQKIIDRAIQKKIQQGNRQVNLESMVALVRSERDIQDWSNYTYYELKVDYATILRKEEFRSIHVYRVMGSKSKIPDFAEILEVHSNPLGEDVLFKKNDRTKDSY